MRATRFIYELAGHPDVSKSKQPALDGGTCQFIELRERLKSEVLEEFLDGHDPLRSTYNPLTGTMELTRSDGAVVEFVEPEGVIGDWQVWCYGWEMSDSLEAKVRWGAEDE